MSDQAERRHPLLSDTLNASQIRSLQSALLDWFTEHARAFPWRVSATSWPNPYHVLVSEILLQQTQAARGAARFQAFLERFPTPEDLAAAPLVDVLKVWEGLGYYARARHLHRAAEIIARQGMPTTFETLLALPGVGHYTAAAVASIAFAESVAAVDGNARRVLARLFAKPAPEDRWLQRHAAMLLDQNRPGTWNQALMELGARVCTPRGPRCALCPLELFCQARAQGQEHRIPQPRSRARVQQIRAVALVVARLGEVLLGKRPAEGLLGGLSGVPLEVVQEGQTDAQASYHLEQSLELEAMLQTAVLPVWLGEVEHRMTHRHFYVSVFYVDVSHLKTCSKCMFNGMSGGMLGDMRFLRPESVPLSQLDKKILALCPRLA